MRNLENLNAFALPYLFFVFQNTLSLRPNYKGNNIMGRKVKQLRNYTTEQVEALFGSDENNLVGVKLYAVIQLTRGYSTRKLQGFYRVTHKQICNWADRFDAEGIEGLRLKAGRGRHSRLNKDQKYRLQGDLLKSPEVFGYNTANWSGPLMREHVQKTYQVDYKPAAVYNLMHELGFSFQRAKAFYPERNETKRQEFKTDIKKL
jgi:transposase